MGGAPSLSETGTYIDIYIYHRFFMQGEPKKAAHKRLENLEYKRLKSSCTTDMATLQPAPIIKKCWRSLGSQSRRSSSWRHPWRRSWGEPRRLRSRRKLHGVEVLQLDRKRLKLNIERHPVANDIPP